jgi:hypothetical protein
MHAHAKLFELVKSGLTPQITFTAGCEDMEGYPEAGMKARVLAVTAEDRDIYRVKADFQSFDEHNKAFESANYYDKNGIATLTARQAGFYKPVDDFYLTPDEGLEYFTIDDAKSVQLFERFKQAGYAGSYVSWLEEQLVAAEQKLG